MAESILPAQVEYPSKTIQELVTNSEGLPERYIYKDSKDHPSGVLDASLPLLEIPVIDLDQLTSS